MAKFHFFTDVDLLNPQIQSQSYGPVLGNETTQYRLTSRFTTTQAARAFAVCDGIVFVQPVAGSSTLVNLILKPTISDLENGFTPVEYFIYRGLKKENFIDTNHGGDKIVASNDAKSTGLTNSVWADFNYFKGLDPSIGTEPKVNSIGWDKNSLPDSTLLTEIFYANDSNFQLAHVSQGDLIGYFEGVSNPGGFEIVLKDHLYLPDLAMLRAVENKITVAMHSGTDKPGNEPIARMRDRERILNYIDPTAYFMLFYEGGIHYRNSNGTSGNANNYTNIFNNIVSKFHTKNTLYIDIRNENGYSLNYYKDNEGQSSDGDYGYHIQYSINSGNFVTNVYYSNYWPILTLNVSPNSTSNFNQIAVEFRNLYNPSPLIYLDYCQILQDNTLILPNNADKFIDETPIVLNPVDWSNPYIFNVPNLSTLSGTTQIAWYIKLYNIRKFKPTGATLPPTVVSRNNYMDNVFGPVVQISNLLGNKTQWILNSGKRYVDGIDEIGVAGMYETGVGFSSNDVLFFAKMIDFYKPGVFEIPIDTYIEPNPTNSGTTLKLSVIEAVKDGQLANINAEVQKRKLLLQGQTFYTHEVNHKDPTNPFEKYWATLLLTRTEYNALVSGITNLNSDYHQPLIQFSAYTTFKDDEFKTFQSTLLNVGGYDNNGDFILYNSTLDLKVLDGLRFNTINTGSNIQIAEKITSPFVLPELITLVQKVEATYGNINGVVLDEAPHKTVTRIRVHYYGWPGQKGFSSKLKAIAFNKGVPASPYIEQNPYSNASCNNPASVIPPSISLNKINSSCRIRRLYDVYPHQISEDGVVIKTELDSSTFIKLSSIQDLKIGSTVIDIGHVFYGLDALLHDSDAQNPTGKPALPFRNPNITEGFDIQNSIDFTSFVGDLASVLGEAYLEKNGDSSQVTTTLLDDYYDNPKNPNKKFDSTDQYGDIDIWGIKKAWDKLTLIQAGFKFSDVINFYYGSLTANHDSVLPEHYSKRFTHFCKANGLIDSSNIWIADDVSSTGIAIRNGLKDRIKKFTVFYYGARLNPIRGNKEPIQLETQLLTDRGTIDITSWFKNFNDGHIGHVLGKFLTFVKNGHDSE